ncbi:MAG: hypothetical protein ACJ73S_05765 [Mycobacteriales bacterium]
MSTRRVVAWTAAGALAVVLTGGVAYAAVDPTGSSSPTPKSSDSAKAGKHHPRLGRGIHGEFTVKRKDNQFATLDAQRGAVTAVDGGSLTVKSADGYTHRYVVNSDTRVRKDGQKSDIGSVKVGDTVGVLATKSGNTDTAKLVRDGKADK